MKSKILFFVGLAGVITTIMVGLTAFSSNDVLCVPFIVIGILLSIIIIALSEILDFMEKSNK